MRAASALLRPALALAASAAGACSGVDNGVGSPCEKLADCADDLQCLDHTCVPRCQRAPDCGDGFACSADGTCIAGVRRDGEPCASEVECEPGLACTLDLTDGGDGVLGASCAPDHDGHAFGELCERDAECRNGTCALGRCVDVCAVDRDCATGHVCTSIPRIDDEATHQGSYSGCLPAGATIAWKVPFETAASPIFIPVPGNARSAVVVMEVDDSAQYVGAAKVIKPDGEVLLDRTMPAETTLRHVPGKHQSALMIPSTTGQLAPGAYQVTARSYRDAGGLIPGSATPRVTAFAKLGDGTVLDLHFYIVDLAEHPCQARIGGETLTATAARDRGALKAYTDEIRRIFARAGISTGEITFDDIVGHPDLVGLEAAALPDLLSLAWRPGGVSVFLVRTITPVGLQALSGGGDNPGAPSVGSPTGGVAVGIDTMCYRSWESLARVTAHAVARHMGLFRNVEPEGLGEDPIADSPGREDLTQATDNLMYFSEFGGLTLTNGQRDILRRSAVLR